MKLLPNIIDNMNIIQSDNPHHLQMQGKINCTNDIYDLYLLILIAISYL